MKFNLNKFVDSFKTIHQLDLEESIENGNEIMSFWSNDNCYSLTCVKVGNEFTMVDVYTPVGVVWLDGEGQQLGWVAGNFKG